MRIEDLIEETRQFRAVEGCHADEAGYKTIQEWNARYASLFYGDESEDELQAARG